MNETLRHIGVIMDGNRRWAQRHETPVPEGHKAGFDALFALIPVIKKHGVPYVTVYAFSTENWLRSRSEVNAIMKLLLWVVKHKLETFKKEGIRIRIIGSQDRIPANILAALKTAELETADGVELTLGVCFNYGGRQEIVDAARRIVASGLRPDQITTESFSKHLYAPEIPAMDLLIRTSGEQRLSGYMLWRSEYAELYFTDVLWPDFDESEFEKALDAYAERKRRHGA